MSLDLDRLMAKARDVRVETVVVDDITIRVRQPSAAVISRYSVLWTEGRDAEALAFLFRHCVVDGDGATCLTDEQATALAAAGGDLGMPIHKAILSLMPGQKKADAPGADGVPPGGASGAPTV